MVECSDGELYVYENQKLVRVKRCKHGNPINDYNRCIWCFPASLFVYVAEHYIEHVFFVMMFSALYFNTLTLIHWK